MSKIKHIPTKKIKEILDNPYGQTIIGTDYEYYKTELKEVLWQRQQRQLEKRIAQHEREIEDYETDRN